MDPMTLALIAKGIISGAQAVGGMVQSKRAKKESEELKKKGVPKMSTPQEYYELYRKAQLDKGMQLEQAQIQNTMASSLAALERGGSRSLIGAAPSVITQTSTDMAKAAQAGYEREAAALEKLADAKLQSNKFSLEAAANQYNLDKEAAAKAFTAGRQTTVNAFGDLASTGAELVEIIGESKKNKNGGAIKTPGKFSHDTNPLHVLNNQGKKVAEVTGEEVLVFNPSQVKSLYKESEKGNTNLHKKVRSLLKKFNSK